MTLRFEMLPNELHAVDIKNNGIVENGINSLDDVLKIKLQRGGLCMIASCFGMGKKTLAVQIAGTMAIGKITAKSEISDVSFTIIGESSIPTLQEIEEQIIDQNAEIVIFDFSLLVGSDERFSTVVQDISRITYRLKQIAKDLETAMICILPLNIAAMMVRGKGCIPRPEFQDLRMFGSIEQDCDVIIFIHQERDAQDDSTEIIVAKNRYGGTGTVQAVFDEEQYLFVEK